MGNTKLSTPYRRIKLATITVISFALLLREIVGNKESKNEFCSG